MSTIVRRISTVAVLAASTMILPVLCTTVGAGSLVFSLPCVSGNVSSSDYSELSLNFRDGIWSMRKGVELVSESPDLTLAVVDQQSNSACTDGAVQEAVDGEPQLAEEAEENAQKNSKNRCNFRSNIGTKFIVRIDNTQGTSRARYQLCPY